MLRLCALLVVCLPAVARAEPVKLRFATMAPDGTTWAREMHSFSRDTAAQTAGQVGVKWFLGGIAGDEFAVIDRIRKGQIDGAGLSLACESLAPSLRVLRMVGLIRSREESRHVLGRMRKRVEQELANSGFVQFGIGNFGSIVLFSRAPIRSFAEMKKTRLWVWDRDDVWIQLLRKMGLQPVPMPVEQAGPAYAAGQIDGFLSVPGAALVFQWSSQARYFTDLHTGLLPTCLVLSQRAFDALPLQQRTILQSSAAKFAARFEEIGRQLDEALVGRLFQKQGLKRVAVDDAFLSEFFAAASAVRPTLDPKLMSPTLLTEVLGWLADFRAGQR